LRPPWETLGFKLKGVRGRTAIGSPGFPERSSIPRFCS
jgi:hypothetical protein